MHAREITTCTDAETSLEPAHSIYVFEQDEYVANLLHMMLTREGFQVSAISDESSIPTVIETQAPPSLVFMDCDWLNDNSLPFHELIAHRHEWVHTPIVLLANCYNADMIEQHLDLGINDYLMQPFEPGQLLNVIQRNLN